eukprot:2648942-Pleurochrysis_carterae.AAC.1
MVGTIMLRTDEQRSEIRPAGTYSPGHEALNCRVGKMSGSEGCSMPAVIAPSQVMSSGKLVGAPVAGLAGAMCKLATRI